jgi:hypothetical protein
MAGTAPAAAAQAAPKAAATILHREGHMAYPFASRVIGLDPAEENNNAKRDQIAVCSDQSMMEIKP